MLWLKGPTTNLTFLLPVITLSSQLIQDEIQMLKFTLVLVCWNDDKESIWYSNGFTEFEFRVQ